jgi:septum site-determining protein MinC
MRLRGRSFMAFVLSPMRPIGEWLAALDQWVSSSPNFFAGKPLILDVGRAALTASEISELIAALRTRGIRVMALEGSEDNPQDALLPPVLRGGRPAGGDETIIGGGAEGCAASTSPRSQPPNSLLIETPIRSGQSVIFPSGDVTVLGSVSSGAEIVAGGSIHVYGALRGRAMAGATGNTRARIFCSRNEAELVSVDGYYRTAEQMEERLRHRPAQCWLSDRVLAIAALD